MKKYDDIAVIGKSGLFPGTENLKEFRELLKEGRISIGKVSDEKRERYGYGKKVQEKEYSILEGEEYFDYDYFGIPKDEADAMSPSQRKLFELTVTALEDAGYTKEDVEGKNIGLCYTVSEDDYTARLPEGSKEQIIAQNAGMFVGRLSYYLGTRGTSICMDTTCTSALIGIHEACWQLQNRECEGVLVGAFHLLRFYRPDWKSTEEIMGILSEDGKTHSFGEDACGTGIGEGGGVVFLKRLEDAIRDGDPIDAVIKGSVVRYAGNLVKDYRMPSETVQLETARQTLVMTNIEDCQVGLMEAHGTATKIGDAIEVKALSDAYGGTPTKSCGLTAVKSNLGHLENASGMVSFLKAVLAVQYGEKYPIAGFTKELAGIAWSTSPFYPVKELEVWEQQRRVAAINSYAMNGSYIHMILENYVESGKEEWIASANQRTYLLTVSAKTQKGLFTLLGQHKEALEGMEQDQLLAYTITANQGRTHYPYRMAFTFSNREEGIKKLENQISNQAGGGRKTCQTKELVLLCSGKYEESKGTQGQETYLSEQFTCIQTLREWGVPVKMVLGCGLGNAVVKHWTAPELHWETVKKDGESYARQTSCDLERFETFIRGKVKKTGLLFITLENGILEQQITGKGIAEVLKIDSLHTQKEQLLATLYERGIMIDWNNCYKEWQGRKLHIPTYPFQKERCWQDYKEGNGLC